MAIIRCPYCHAIIDENDKYCGNCGTQLLFPEDDAVEEEIPGEKILDAEEDEEEKDYEVREPGKEPTAGLEGEADEGGPRTGELVTGPVDDGDEVREPLEADKPGDDEGDEEEAEDQEGRKGPEDEELEPNNDETQEIVLVDSPEAAPTSASAAPAETAEPAAVKEPPPEEETRAYAAQPAEKAELKDETRELPVLPAAPKAAGTFAPVPPAETAAEAQAAPKPEDADRPAVPPTFDTRELEGIGRTVDLSKARLDKMIEVMAEKQKERAPEEPAPVPEGKTTGTLPPWADRIRGSGAPVERENTRDTGGRFDKESLAGPGEEEPARGPSGTTAGEGLEDKEEVEIFPRRKRPDSGIGVPEGLAQAALPFGPAEAETAEEEEEEIEEEEAAALEAEAFEKAVAPPAPPAPRMDEVRPAVRPETPAGTELGRAEEAAEEIGRPPFNFSTFFKAKAFDILFIGVFWLVALWVAARSMEATLFELLSVTSTAVLLLYVVFLGLYIFLFKFFLGETLGDRLFKDREERG